MKRKISLTKNRIKQLDIALSLDDILYRKFEVMNKDLNKKIRQFKNKAQVIDVLVKKDGFVHRGKILSEQHTDDGIVVMISL